MNEQLTAFLAIWGAALGTSSLAWNIWTWQQNRQPRLAVEVELRETGNEPEIFYTIRNRGGQATTIEELQLVSYQLGPFCGVGIPERAQYVAACFPKSVSLPAVIAPGGIWTGSSPISSERRTTFDESPSARLELIKKGRLFFKIRCSHFDRSLHGKVRMERMLPFC
jgi:hypothetical protein